jgi:hypothetical protein
VHVKQKALLNEILQKLNNLFDGELTDYTHTSHTSRYSRRITPARSRKPVSDFRRHYQGTIGRFASNRWSAAIPAR